MEREDWGRERERKRQADTQEVERETERSPESHYLVLGSPSMT